MLEIGANHSGKPYTLKGIINILKKEFPEYSFDNDRYIAYWFYSHFYSPLDPEVSKNYLNQRYFDIKKETSLKTESFFTKEAYFAYLEYKELMESRLSADRANLKSIWAIIIALLAFISSIVFSLYDIITY